MKVVAIIQARMGSERLPGKALIKLAGKPCLQRVVERVRMAKTVDFLRVATTPLLEDDPIVEWCVENGPDWCLGHPTDVLDRFFHAARASEADLVVRITADCPLIDPRIIDEVVQMALDDPTVDYATNLEPMTYPEGMGVEVFPFRTLEIAHREAKLPIECEHVTPFFRFKPERFKHARLENMLDESHLRMALDYPEDAYAIGRLIRILEAEVQEPWSLSDIVVALQDNPELQAMLQMHERDKGLREAKAEAGIG